MENNAGDQTSKGSDAKQGTVRQSEPLDADELLVAEFGYIAQSAFQANEDRARVSTYYVVTFGTLVAALFSLQVDSANLADIHRALIIVFLTLALFGVSTLLQLVRLRQAWTECAVAMNQVKDFYVEGIPSVNLNDALRWQMKTIPPQFKPWSIGFLMAVQVALLSGVSMGASVYFLGLVTTRWAWAPAIVVGLIFFGLQILLYRRLLREERR